MEEDNLYQSVIITLSDGNSYVFSGKGNIAVGVTITKIVFTPPKPLSEEGYMVVNEGDKEA